MSPFLASIIQAFLGLSAALSAGVGSGKFGVGIDYEPAQDDTFLAGEDNHYLYATFDHPIADTGFSLTSRIGREDGAFADDKIDWLIGVNKEYIGVNWFVQYIDTNKGGDANSATALFGVNKSF